MICVSIYSDSAIAAAGLRTIIGEITGFCTSGSYSSLDLLEEHARSGQADVLLLQLTPDFTLDTVQRILTATPGIRIILWVNAPPAEFLSQAIGLGVRGILGINSSLESHRECIRSVAAGKVWFDREISQRLLLVDTIAITPREQQLMALLARGLRNKEIASSLGITEGTVKVYLSHLFTKVGASDRLELALLALRNIGSGHGDGSEQTSAFVGHEAGAFKIPPILRRPRARTAAW
jgi:DNA-binding NarL/FixJ family response regulator